MKGRIWTVGKGKSLYCCRLQTRNSTASREAHDRKQLQRQVHHLECDQWVCQEIRVTTAKTNQGKRLPGLKTYACKCRVMSYRKYWGQNLGNMVTLGLVSPTFLLLQILRKKNGTHIEPLEEEMIEAVSQAFSVTLALKEQIKMSLEWAVLSGPTKFMPATLSFIYVKGNRKTHEWARVQE